MKRKHSNPAESHGDEPIGAPTDAAEVGLSARVWAAIPLLRTLVQAVAESEGDWNYLNVTASPGPWVGVARRSWEEELTVLTNRGSRTREPYAAAVHDALVGHGFAFDPGVEGYRRFVPLDSDDVYSDVAHLIVGTFMHAWRVAHDEHLRVDLHLSFLPEGEHQVDLDAAPNRKNLP